MTCQDCEVRLAQGEIDDAVEGHLRGCVECRALHEDLRANALALDELRSEELPRIAVKTPRRRRVYPWVAAAAAAAFVLAALVVPRSAPPKPTASPAASQVVDEHGPPPPPPEAHETAKVETARPRPQKVEPFQPLKIKMLTSDPDVVIYWLIED